MRSLNRRALTVLSAVGLIAAVAAAAQQRPVGVPSVVPPGGEATPPPNLPAGGPSATSGAAAAARFDEVGYAAIGGELRGVTVAAAGLHPGSYAEVTALDSGRIILAAVAPGAAPADRLALLSPGAARALGVAGAAVAIRVREVEPQAGDEAALRRGEPASPRLAAPASLLVGLRARLADVASGPAASPVRPADHNHSAPAVATGPARAPDVHLKPPVAKPARQPVATPSPKAAPTPHAAAKAAATPHEPAKAAPAGRYHVQVGTFSNEGNARKLAASLGGHVDPAGTFWRVELGPFADQRAAQQARDGVAKQGYGGAEVRKD